MGDIYIILETYSSKYKQAMLWLTCVQMRKISMRWLKMYVSLEA